MHTNNQLHHASTTLTTSTATNYVPTTTMHYTSTATNYVPCTIYILILTLPIYIYISIKYIQYKCIIKHTQPVIPSWMLPKPYYPQYNLPGDNTLYSWDMIDTLTIAQDMTYLLSYMMCMSMNRAIMYHLYIYSVHDLCETCMTSYSRHQHHMIYYTVLCVV